MARYAQKVDSTSFLINMTTVLYLSRLGGIRKDNLFGFGYHPAPSYRSEDPQNGRAAA